MASRKGALAQADRLWLGCAPLALNSAPKSVITSLAGFAGVGSVITSLAGFGAVLPQPPGERTAIPAALRPAPIVSRRMGSRDANRLVRRGNREAMFQLFDCHRVIFHFVVQCFF